MGNVVFKRLFFPLIQLITGDTVNHPHDHTDEV